jgi:hypothetical protein
MVDHRCCTSRRQDIKTLNDAVDRIMRDHLIAHLMLRCKPSDKNIFPNGVRELSVSDERLIRLRRNKTSDAFLPLTVTLLVENSANRRLNARN